MALAASDNLKILGAILGFLVMILIIPSLYIQYTREFQRLDLLSKEASRIDGSFFATSSGPFLHIKRVELESNKRVFQIGQSFNLKVTVGNDDEKECEATVSLYATTFDHSPSETQKVILPAKQQTTLFWNMAPKVGSSGIQSIVIHSGLTSTTLGLAVTDAKLLTPSQYEILTTLATFLGPAITLPWWLSFWQRHRRKKQAQNQKGPIIILDSPKISESQNWFKRLGERVYNSHKLSRPIAVVSSGLIFLVGLAFVSTLIFSHVIPVDSELTELRKIAEIPKLGGKVVLWSMDRGGSRIDVKWEGYRDSLNIDDLLIHLRSVSSLRALSFSNRATDNSLKYLRDMSNLEELDLYYSRITNTGLSNLSVILNLHILNLGGTAITDSGLIYLRTLANLYELSLSETDITGSGLIYLDKLDNLKKLNLSSTQISDENLIYLTRLKNLEEVNLLGTRISEEGLLDLVQLPKLKKLRYWRPGLSKEFTDQLKQALPDLEILSY